MKRRLIPDLFHLALAPEWEAGVQTGIYERSTRGLSLEEVGFIHLSFVWQVERVATLFYADCTEPLVLLRVDPDRLTAPLKVEPVAGQHFPHLYGQLPTDAVVEVLAFTGTLPVDLSGT